MVSMTEPAPLARSAATAVIFRDRSDAPPELLMMERSKGMAFAAGALVFPGGAVDDADLEQARALSTALPIDEAAARIAAIRETLEESGLGIGFRAAPDRFTLATMRESMAAGKGFAELLTEAGIALDLDALVPFARWHPNTKEAARRVFDTRFYLARLAEGSHEPTVDATENVHLFWATARAVLDACDRGEGRIIFPTRRNLERLAQFNTFANAADHARATPIEKVTPWIEDRSGAAHLCIPDHLGYPVTSEAIATALRG
jgi:8-oxo-dGTP pyrophosphatase MutT (NUDIX family)